MEKDAEDVENTEGATVTRGAAYPRPASRRFRVYAFDPRAAVAPETAAVNNTVISLAWEASYEDPLTKGPTGEYVEVVDYDAPRSDSTLRSIPIIPTCWRRMDFRHPKAVRNFISRWPTRWP